MTYTTGKPMRIYTSVLFLTLLFMLAFAATDSFAFEDEELVFTPEQRGIIVRKQLRPYYEWFSKELPFQYSMRASQEFKDAVGLSELDDALLNGMLKFADQFSLEALSLPREVFVPFDLLDNYSCYVVYASNIGSEIANAKKSDKPNPFSTCANRFSDDKNRMEYCFHLSCKAPTKGRDFEFIEVLRGFNRNEIKKVLIDNLLYDALKGNRSRDFQYDFGKYNFIRP